MQLSRGVSWLACVVLFTTRSAVAGDETIKASSEIAAYRDSFAVSVVTPTIAASVESPTAGW